MSVNPYRSNQVETITPYKRTGWKKVSHFFLKIYVRCNKFKSRYERCSECSKAVFPKNKYNNQSFYHSLYHTAQYLDKKRRDDNEQLELGFEYPDEDESI